MGRKIRIFSLGRKNNILIKQKRVYADFDLIFMRMTVQVTTYFHTNSFAQRLVLPHRGKSKLGIGLFIHELLREPLISATLGPMLVRYFQNLSAISSGSVIVLASDSNDEGKSALLLRLFTDNLIKQFPSCS